MKNQKTIIGVILAFSWILAIVTAIDYFIFTGSNESGTFHMAFLVLLHLMLSALFITLSYQNASFEKTKKIKWSVYLALVPFVSCITFYLTYSSAFDRIKMEVEEKMISKASSLQEFARNSN